MPRRMDLRMMRDMARNSRRMRDGRNPYGSRGGYITRTRPRRDRAMESEMPRERMEHYDRNKRMYDYELHNPEYRTKYSSDYATGEYNPRDSVYNRELYGYYGDTPFEIRRGYSMGDHMMDYPKYMRKDYNYDYRMDYGEDKTILDEEELDEWLEELMEKFDSREKEMFREDKVIQRAKEMGIKFDHFTPKEFLVTAVMLYTDYKKTLGMANVDIYLKLAKDWLMDDDVEMKHGEKLAAYYDNVVMAE